MNIFIILHYKALNDTTECIESILNNIENSNYKIIVVDNGSMDGTGQKLLDKYLLNEKVKVLISEVNLGFANGNNLGCNYAIENYSPDFLIVINNDTLIEQGDFLKRISLEYENSEFDIMGPDILTRDGKHQNPHVGHRFEKSSIQRVINKLIITKIATYLKMDHLLKFFASYLKKMLKIEKLRTENRDWSIRKEDVLLHGSALIFSKKYYKRYVDVFYNKTFMYCEEDILNYIRQRDNLKSVYEPQLKIFHKEDASTDLILTTESKKKLFILKHSIKSLKVLKELINN